MNVQTSDIFTNMDEGGIGSIENYFFLKAFSSISEPQFAYNIQPDLWVSDGTNRGTVKIGNVGFIEKPTTFTRLANKILFFGYDSQHGKELWVSDGTLQRSYLLKDIVTGLSGSFVTTTEFIILDNKAYFLASDNSGTINIWRTDGTELFRNIGTSTSTGYIVSALKQVGSKFFYIVAKGNPNTSYEVWSSDGTIDGTVMAASIPTSNNGSMSFTATTNRVYFTLVRGSLLNLELWTSDGSNEGTVKLLNYSPTSIFAEPKFGIVDNKLLFLASSQNKTGLWSSDGSIGGTNFIKPMSSTIASFFTFNHEGYFWAVQDQRVSNNYNLWRTDGTSNNTKIAFPQLLEQRDINKLYSTNNKLFVIASDGSKKRLWVSDVNRQSLEMIKDSLNTKIELQSDVCFTTNSTIFFPLKSRFLGNELWVSNGTSQGTHFLKDINTATKSSISYDFSEGRVINNNLYFASQEYEDARLELTIANEKRAVFVKDSLPNSNREFPQYLGRSPSLLADLGRGVLFSGLDSLHGQELWLTNSTNNGTVLLKDINLGKSSSNPTNVIQFGLKSYFEASDGIHGRELWVTDGTTTGTNLVRDFYPDNSDEYSSIYSKIWFDNKLILITQDAQYGRELWKMEENENLFVRLIDRTTTSQIHIPIHGLKVHQNKIYYIANTSTNSPSLWSTNAEIGGAQLIKEMRIYPLSSASPQLHSFKNWLFMYASDISSSNLTGLWRSDGTTEGTIPILKNAYILDDKIVIGTQYLYFATEYTLWKSDGTPSGTQVVKVFDSNLYSGTLKELKYVNGHVYFEVVNLQTGVELWQSDGTLENTFLLENISANHSPTALKETYKIFPKGTGFYFIGNDSEHGRELWFYDTCSYPTNIVSLKSGNWNDSDTWSCGQVPKSTDITTIENGNIIEITNQTFTRELNLVNGSVLFNGGTLHFP